MKSASSHDSKPARSARTGAWMALDAPAGHVACGALVGVIVIALFLGGEARAREPAAHGEEPMRALRLRVVEEDHPERGVPNACVNVWRISRVRPGEGIERLCACSEGRSFTDKEGWATLDRIRRSAAYIQVTASGFTMARRTVAAADEVETAIEVALERGTVVSGKVYRADGTVSVGVRVCGTQSEQLGWIVDSYESTTDSGGTFRLSGLHPGLVDLQATLHDGESVWSAEVLAQAGSTNADIRLQAEPTRRRIRVMARGADGRAIARARWDLAVGWFGEGRKRTPIGDVENGEFVLPADADVQYVTISRPIGKDGIDLPLATTVVGPLGARGGDLEVVMPSGVTISGTVRDDRGFPMQDVLVCAKPLFMAGEAEQAVWKGWLHSRTDAEGRFHVDGVPLGRVEAAPYREGWFAEPVRSSAPSDRLDFVMHPLRWLHGSVRHADGTRARDAVVYLGGEGAEDWTLVHVREDGNFSVSYFAPRKFRLRAGLAPSAVEDMAASEVAARPGVDSDPIVLTVPNGRGIRVRIAEWPESAIGVARLSNGPNSPGRLVWVLGNTATFEGVDPSAPLSFYCGPLPDGRIAFSSGLSTAGAEAIVPLVPSRSIQGRALGFPSNSRPDRAWAESGAFQAPGRMGLDGTFVIRGVPPGACRVCVVFRRGEEVWAGCAEDGGSTVPVDVRLRQMDEASFAAWLRGRPPR